MTRPCPDCDDGALAVRNPHVPEEMACSVCDLTLLSENLCVAVTDAGYFSDEPGFRCRTCSSGFQEYAAARDHSCGVGLNG